MEKMSLSLDHDFLINYHIGEESLIFLICFFIARRAFIISRSADLLHNSEVRSRTFLVSGGFALLGINSLVHAVIHAAGLNLNILYQTLIGYCLGLLTLIVAISSERPWKHTYFPFLYLPLLFMLIPRIYEQFPIFNQFRPLVWMLISYLSGIVSILYLATYYHTQLSRYLLSSIGHLLICISAIALFFPTGIGSNAWIYGHVLRPLGFGILFFSMNKEELLNMRESILFKFITTFSLMVAFPVLIFGTIVLYENIQPIQLFNKRILVFVLALIALSSALIFTLVLIIRLMRPLLQLKDSMDRIADSGLEGSIPIERNDEIGKLSRAFNDMVMKLRHSLSERDRLSRLAATGELSATLAHEIKNPLNAIGAAAVYLRKNFKGGLIREFGKIIYDEVSRINKLTANLLTFAKPVQPDFQPSDINNLVMETIDLFRKESEERGLALETELDTEIPEISFDYNLIKQVLINLMLNSFDAMDKEGTVSIETRASNSSVLIAVKDNGAGIDEQTLKNIFNPFFTTKTRGTGLGLSISRKTMKDHGGDISVESVPGKGSTFTILLPVKK